MNNSINGRILAFIIDYFCIILFGGLLFIPFADIVYVNYKIFILIFTLYYTFGIMLKDLFGQSLGKKIAGIKIVSDNGQKAPKYKLILRNITCFMWPIEFAVVALSEDHTRLTDKALGLKVVKKL